MKNKLLKILSKAIISLVILIILFFLMMCIETYQDLKKCNYTTIKDIPQTIAVSLNLSKGFIIGKNEYGNTIFIGDEHYIYEDMFAEIGYYEIYRMGLLGFYSKNVNDDFEQSDFTIMSGDRYHWFRLYESSNEEVIKNCLNKS